MAGLNYGLDMQKKLTILWMDKNAFLLCGSKTVDPIAQIDARIPGTIRAFVLYILEAGMKEYEEFES